MTRAGGELLSQWAVWMQGEGLADRTITDRLDLLRRFAAEGLDLVDATPHDLATILGNPAWRPTTRRTYYAALEAWYRWLQRQGHRGDNPTDLVRAPRVPRRRPRPISTPELGDVLAHCNRRRTRGMVLLEACQGLRAHEVALMRGEYLRGGQLRVIGKGGVDVEIPAHPAVIELAQYFPRIGLWFPSYRDPSQPVTAKNVSRVVGEVMKRAGVNASGHQLRHWFGTETLRTSGGNLRTTQEAMRHASPAATAIYTLVDNDQVRAAIEALPVPMYVVNRGKPRGRSSGICADRRFPKITDSSARSQP